MHPMSVAVLAVLVMALGAGYAAAPPAAGSTESQQALSIGTLDLTGITTHEIEPTDTIATGLHFVTTMAVAGGRVWTASPEGLVSIDPATNEATLVSAIPGASVTGDGDTLVRAAFALNHVEKWTARTFHLEWTADSEAPSGSAIVGNEVWVADHHSGTLSIRSLTDGSLLDQVKVGALGDGGPANPLEVDGTIWVTDFRNHRVVAVDVASRRVTARVQVSPAVQFCDQPSAATASAVWISDCTTLVTHVDLASRATTTVDAGAPVAAPLVVSGQAWVPIGGRLVRLHDDLTADRAVSIAGQPLAFGGVVAFGAAWVNVGFGTIVRLPSPDTW